ncbi:MAG: lamin tail domain-containing protein, partial [Candidatus Latescibacteria bacterium]|nr:lamin tail domain-containing protein [Candidatus Latescibacterota bacterium]
MKLLQKSSLLLITIFTITLIDIHSGLSEETTPLINEIMSSNASTIKDEDGDYSDWIEIYNPGDLPIDLAGYGLSDRADDPFKWIFPELILDAEKHLLVFASGKDRTDTPNHWETVITQDEEWKYFVGINEPPEDWRFLKFDDSGWDSGSSGFGFGDNDDETIVRQVTSFYIRKTFNVEDIANIIQGILQIDYDDAFVAYLNGTEFARANFPGTLGTPPPYNQTSVESREAKMYTGGNPSVFSIENIQALLVEGENIIAIQVHNYNIFDTDLTA